MSSRILPRAQDPIEPEPAGELTITVDGSALTGIAGQSIAGVMLAAGQLAWRTTAARGRPRGVFCGIGVCFDCLVTVNGLADVRACQRVARDGDIVESQGEPTTSTSLSAGGRS